jgi:hypothetical protein
VDEREGVLKDKMDIPLKKLSLTKFTNMGYLHISNTSRTLLGIII